MTRAATLFRSDAVLRPGPEDVERLRPLRIGLVLDLRSAGESGAHPNAYFQEAGAEVLQLDIGTDVRAKGSFWEALAADCSPEAVLGLVYRIYRAIPRAVAPALKTLLERLDAGAPATLVHCTAGKDRTGVLIALLLDVIGVPREAVLNDYLETQSRLTDAVRERGEQTLREVAGRPVPAESVDLLVGVREDFLAQSFGWVERKFGTPLAFLRAEAGLTDTRLARIREELLEIA